MTKNDYKLDTCPMCKTALREDPRPGVRCANPQCESYLEVVLSGRGRKKGALRWHHPLECVENHPACDLTGPCAVYVAIGPTSA